MPTITTNGTKFYYEAAGTGRPLLMLHAGIADSRMWEPQFQSLAQDAQVIRFDMRGYGQTPLGDGEFSYPGDVLAIMDALDIEQAILMGCSYGGRMALDVAISHPERVSGLILVTTVPGGFQTAPPDGIEQIEATLEAGDFEGASELEVQMWVDGPQRTPDQVDPAIRDLVREMNLIALKNDTSTPDTIVPLPMLDVTERLHEIRVPTLVMIGELDQPSRVEGGNFLASGIPGAQKVTLPAAHLPNLELPDEFNRLVREFLGQV